MRLEFFGYAMSNLLHRKLRSGLTVLSILIGITAIFALVSFGMGIQSYVDQIAQNAGVDKLFVQAKGIGAPGTDDNFAITQDDVDFIDKVNGVAEATGNYVKGVAIKKDKQTKFVFGVGYDPDKAKLIEGSFSVTVIKGRQLRKGDDDKIVLGYNYKLAKKGFDKPVDLGEKLEVGGKEFEVIGFYEPIGNPHDDTNAYFTHEGMESMFPEAKERYGYAIVRSEQGVKTEELADLLKERLRKHKGQKEGKEDFFVQTFEDALKVFGNIVMVINGILFLIALISLVVASVNTMNTMYTAVVERTKEIGIMKAVGATNKDILYIFIIEAGIIGMIGGILGVVFGFGIASVGGSIAAAYGFGSLQPVFPLALVVGCILFSFLVGALSGILPARQAARLRPVDALRYE